MRLCKVLFVCSVFSLTACASSSFEASLAAYGKRLDECSDIAKSNTKPFPVTPWFSQLNLQQKKNVVLFISLDNRNACSKAEKETLKKASASVSEEKRNALLALIQETDYQQYV
ncbi:hypothetical protein VA7868_04574 [Vibrio aerogenes CECT 7868]|uniref:Lipoprotein n=1 Tax=Vibrio aerogenes CECT 7868 TaxID=1216006 RepID=A0A1M6F400_9VIBR|nr:hypothetical protein [Vibrio aerogenes]SHI92386.1 hypothetical protein VA7868_04574 [Vibrio aerogenes CECT 7868]